MTMPRKAMILAAGLGTRMRPLTDHIPKPMVEVAGKKLIDYAIEFFVTRGIHELVINSSYKAEILEAHLANCTAARIHISREEVPLETGGGIAKALPLLGSEPFFCLNSDVIIGDPSQDVLTRMATAADARSDAVLLLHPRARAIGYDGAGDFLLTPEGRLQRRGEATHAPYVFAGLQWLHPRLFAAAPTGAFSMNRLYNQGIATDGTLADNVHATVHQGDWLHVGDPAGLASATDYLTR